MLTYDVDGAILILTATGTVSAIERQDTFAAIASDPRVPRGALVLVDARRTDPAVTLAEVEERAHRLVHFLGPKLGGFCAVIAPPRLTGDVEHFRAASGEMGLRVEVFSDEPAARKWLATLARQGG